MILLILIQHLNATAMKTIVYNSEKNAKIYEIRSAKDQGVYQKGELVMTVKTDEVKSVIKDSQYEYYCENREDELMLPCGVQCDTCKEFENKNR